MTYTYVGGLTGLLPQGSGMVERAVFLCDDCGALVMDKTRHDLFHEKLDLVKEVVYGAPAD